MSKIAIHKGHLVAIHYGSGSCSVCWGQGLQYWWSGDWWWNRWECCESYMLLSMLPAKS